MNLQSSRLNDCYTGFNNQIAETNVRFMFKLEVEKKEKRRKKRETRIYDP